MSERKYTHKHVCILILWNFFESMTNFVCLPLVVVVIVSRSIVVFNSKWAIFKLCHFSEQYTIRCKQEDQLEKNTSKLEQGKEVWCIKSTGC
jgi:hypothetical protein